MFLRHMLVKSSPITHNSYCNLNIIIHFMAHFKNELRTFKQQKDNCLVFLYLKFLFKKIMKAKFSVTRKSEYKVSQIF